MAPLRTLRQRRTGRAMCRCRRSARRARSARPTPRPAPGSRAPPAKQLQVGAIRIDDPAAEPFDRVLHRLDELVEAPRIEQPVIGVRSQQLTVTARVVL